MEVLNISFYPTSRHTNAKKKYSSTKLTHGCPSLSQNTPFCDMYSNILVNYGTSMYRCTTTYIVAPQNYMYVYTHTYGYKLLTHRPHSARAVSRSMGLYPVPNYTSLGHTQYTLSHVPSLSCVPSLSHVYLLSPKRAALSHKHAT